MRIRIIIALLIALVAVAPSRGQTPLGTAFTYQGQLKENGAPIDGAAHLRFSLWNAAGSGSPPVGGSQIGASQLVANVAVVNGLFTVPLNAGGQFGANAFNGEGRWLQVEVCADAGCGTLTVLSPRQGITAVPYAMTALTALSTVGIDGHSLDAADGNPADALFVDNAGKVGIGTSTPLGKLDVRGDGLVLAYLEGTSTLGAWLRIKSATTDGRLWGILSSSTDNGEGPGDLVFFDGTAGITRMNIDGPTGNVGIGSIAPENKLHVMKGSAGVVTGHANAPLVVENSTHAYINLLTPDANERGMLFGSPTAGATAGGIIYNSAATPEGLQFRTGGNVNRMVIDSTGDVGIGTNTPAVKLHLEGGTDTAPAGGGFLVAGSTTSMNISIDNNEIMARNNGAVATLTINNNGGDIVFGGAIDIGYERVTAYSNSFDVVTANCPAGKRVIAGGCAINGDAEIKDSYPVDNGWRCEANDIYVLYVLTSYAICANVK